MRALPQIARAIALLTALTLGCTPRGGGGTGPLPGPGAGDGGSSMDGGVAADVAPATDSPSAPADAPVPTDVPAPQDVVTPTADAPAIDLGVAPPVDVPAGPTCGNGVCGKGETCTSCPADCGACPARCGDGMCNSGETCTSCPSDCGACPARCGDGMCNSGETCTSCPSDCGACPATCTATTCGACAENPACGWCRGESRCVARSGASCADLVTSATNCAVTPPLNVTTPCTVSSTDARNDCGFRHVTSTSCTPGATVSFGCTAGADAGACEFGAGTCVGDPVMRICAGNTTTGCAFASRLVPMNAGVGTVTADDDACGLCPWVRIACPASGQISVFTRAYNVASSATCTVVFR